MKLNEVGEKLLEKYLTAGFEIIKKKESEILFKKNLKRKHDGKEVGFLVSFTESDLIQYEALSPELDSLTEGPGECAIHTSIYREQLLGPQLKGAETWLESGETILFGDLKPNHVGIVIGPCSDLFFHKFRFSEYFIRNTMKFPHGQALDKIHRPVTILVQELETTSKEECLRISSDLFNACLFHLSFEMGLELALCNNWKQSRKLSDFFVPKSSLYEKTLPIPRSKYDSDLLRYYSLANVSSLPTLEYLSFYHILEHFFNSVSNKNLYDRLGSIIRTPSFRATSSELDGIVEIFKTHYKNLKDDERLKLVLKEYIDETELIKFITKYEKELKENIYTEQRTLFGKTVKVTLREGQVIHDVVVTIYSIRNAIVHSADSEVRVVPFSETANLLTIEMPLIRFIAEKLIIASAVPIF